MARLARFVHSGLAYHVTHRGNRGQPIFITDQDRHVYRELLEGYARRAVLAICALRAATRTGRPCGSPEWVRALEAQANRKLAPRPVGRPPKLDGQVESMDLFGG
jgi:hypothetical protein